MQRKDAESFIRACVQLIGMGFHPDTPFLNYTKRDGSPIFSEETAAKYQQNLEEAFAILGDGVYEVGLDEMHKHEKTLPQDAHDVDVLMLFSRFKPKK